MSGFLFPLGKLKQDKTRSTTIQTVRDKITGYPSKLASTKFLYPNLTDLTRIICLAECIPK